MFFNLCAQWSRCFPYVLLVAVRALDVLYHTTRCRFVCLVFRVHQQGPQGVDKFVVHWYIIGFENHCQLFRQGTNVGETYGILYYVGFYCVYILFVSPWMYGVKNPRFVAVQFQDHFMCSASLVLPSSSDVTRSALCKKVHTTERLCSDRWYDFQFTYWSVCVSLSDIPSPWFTSHPSDIIYMSLGGLACCSVQFLL